MCWLTFRALALRQSKKYSTCTFCSVETRGSSLLSWHVSHLVTILCRHPQCMMGRGEINVPSLVGRGQDGRLRETGRDWLSAMQWEHYGNEPSTWLHQTTVQGTRLSIILLKKTGCQVQSNEICGFNHEKEPGFTFQSWRPKRCAMKTAQ